ncbi:MAG: hypothetical protein AMXMBFR84_28800 [Candidatus Hydrogenedentota bacterium]
MTKLKRYILLSLAVGVLTGCATTSLGIQGRDMSQYPEVNYEGPFRGRWWNYYERGRAFADSGKYWVEAEEDFRTAMLTRKGDQLWPRTYGLHFIPEYFPNRELGIALYHQGRYDEAIDVLRLSYEQTESARAAYFIERALKDKLSQAGADTEDPTIELASPSGGVPVGSLVVDVEGVARDDNYIARITIDGQPYALKIADNPVAFKQSVVLRPGQNTITVETEDVLGKKAVATVDIKSDVDGPALSFDRPLTLPGTVTGAVNDVSGVESVTIGGAAATLTSQADGTYVFSAGVSKSVLAAPVLYESKDTLGNITRGQLTADGVMLSSALPETMFASYRPEVVEVAPGIRALALNGRVVAMAAVPAAAEATPEIRFTNLRPDQVFRIDEILVSLDVVTPTPVSTIDLNGIPLDTVPGRSVQRLSRRIRLDQGVNQLEATVKDDQGNQTSAGVSILRELSPLEDTSGRLTVSLLGNVWKGKGQLLNDEDRLIVSLLDSELRKYDRFNFVNRDDLGEVLSEQQLAAALGSREGRAALGGVAMGSITPAEVLLIGRVYRDADSIEIVLEAVSSETSLFVARMDVAGNAESEDELRQLVGDLALRTFQEFPRVSGQVVNVRGTETTQVTASRATIAFLDQTSLESSESSDEDVLNALQELEREFDISNRFSIVDRENIDAILAEQELSEALGSESARLALEAMEPTDWLIRLSMSQVGIETTVRLEAVDTATSVVAASHMETGAVGSPDDKTLLIRRVATALIGKLPEKAPQSVEYTRGFTSDLSELEGVRESMKYVVYREGNDILDPITNEVVDKEVSIVGEALVDGVGASDSTAAVMITRENQQLGVVQVGDKVVVK